MCLDKKFCISLFENTCNIDIDYQWQSATYLIHVAIMLPFMIGQCCQMW